MQNLLPCSGRKYAMPENQAVQDQLAGRRAYTGDGESSYLGVGVNEKKRLSGRPTTSGDNAPYGQHLKRLQFCTICRLQGHKCTTCPQRGDLPKAPRKLPKCTNCGVVGHRRNACGTKKTGSFEPNFL